MDTTVVFFPGMGYGVDRPLFYYARKQAQQTGSEVVCVDYPSFSPDPSVPAPLQAQAALPGCVNDALAQLVVDVINENMPELGWQDQKSIIVKVEKDDAGYYGLSSDAISQLDQDMIAY